jgi:chromate transporter
VFHWLVPGEMVRGLALAETAPGPLIMVAQFVAFFGAYRHPGDLNPWLAPNAQQCRRSRRLHV